MRTSFGRESSEVGLNSFSTLRTQFLRAPCLLLLCLFSALTPSVSFSVLRKNDAQVVVASGDSITTELAPNEATVSAEIWSGASYNKRANQETILRSDDSFADESVLKNKLLSIRSSLQRQEWSTGDINYVLETLSSTIAGTESSTVSTGLFIASFVEVLVAEANPNPIRSDSGFSSLLSKEVVVAAIWHCLELIHAQNLGLNDLETVRRNIFKQKRRTCTHQHRPSPCMDYSSSLEVHSDESVIPILSRQLGNKADNSVEETTQLIPLQTKSLASTAIPILTPDPTSQTAEESMDQWQISRGAAHMYRVELLTRAVTSPTLSPKESEQLRALLLTVPDFDWRSLLIRCVACLFCLRNSKSRSPESVRAAREGLRVYSSFAEQLGLTSLKARIEDEAFRILYRRQYEAVTSSIYQGPKPGTSMQATASFLTAHIKSLLYTDELLRSQLADVTVTSRVKEPLSLWRKLVKKRTKQLRGGCLEPSGSSGGLILQATQGPTKLVPDSVGIRVILQVDSLTPNESPEARKTREEFLCYYIQEKIQSLWPVYDQSRIKDYIRYPKPNGYQSLHFTSEVCFRGFMLPFEVQVRTNAMHAFAEFGGANHWGYKLRSRAKEGDDHSLVEFSPDVSIVDAEYNQTEDAIVNPYLKALSISQRSAMEQRVYIFTSYMNDSQSGDILAVSRNTRLGELMSTSRAILLNGEAAPKNTVLKSGDVVVFT